MSGPLLTWTTELPRSSWMREEGFRVLEFDQLLERYVRPGLAAGTKRTTVASPFAELLRRFGEYEAVAVRGARLRTIEDLRALYGGVVEPAYRRGCRLLIGADAELDRLDPAHFVEEPFGYPWTLERLRHLAGRAARTWQATPERLETDDGAVRLDPSQRRAVHAHDGVVQVIAPAGSGKTTVLVERVGELLRRRVPGDRILCMTFNRDAASELAGRLAAAGIDGVSAQTFNSVGYQFLREERMLRHPQALTLSQGQWRRLCAQAQRAAGADGVWIEPPVAQALVSDIKLGRLMTPSEWTARAPDDAEGFTLAKLYELYERYLASTRRNDFADQIMLTVRRLREDADARTRWQARFQQVLVDEYQDIEPAQELLVQLLAAPQDGLFAVGDEDQTLYSWRRASVEAIVGLDQLYLGLERMSLEFNYRCPHAVVEGSRALVENNRRRFPKPINAAKPAQDQSPILHREYASPEHAAPDVARRLAASRRGEIVVLARTTRLLRTVAEACVEPDVKISAPEAVFEPRGARAALEGYFRLFADLANATAEDVLTVFRTPSRGLPYEHEQAVVDALRNGLGFSDVAARLPAEGNARHRLEDGAWFLDGLTRLRDAQALIRALRGAGGLDRYFEEYEQLFGGVETVELEQLDDAEREAAGRTVAQYAELLTERTESLRRIRDDEHGIEVTTVHRAKGREWPTVLVFAFDEDQLPHKKAIEDATLGTGVSDALESERRVAYVALTRAKERLILLSSEGKQSRFLAEAGVVSGWDDPEARSRQPSGGRTSAAQRRDVQRPRQMRHAASRHRAPHTTPPVFEAGELILHPLFGQGEVVEVAGQQLHVRFADGRRFVAASRRLKRPG